MLAVLTGDLRGRIRAAIDRLAVDARVREVVVRALVVQTGVDDRALERVEGGDRRRVERVVAAVAGVLRSPSKSENASFASSTDASSGERGCCADRDRDERGDEGETDLHVGSSWSDPAILVRAARHVG